MGIHETSEDKDTFLWKDNEQFSNFTDFRITNGRHRRALEDISKFEYANGVLQIMQTALRLPKSDLIREITKQLGYNRTSSKSEKYIQEAIDLNVEQGLIAEDHEEIIEIIS